jgi:hypothetical protein
VDAGNDRVGVKTATPAVALDVVGQVRASTGILFGSDTAAANALDDYEEGTWTPVFADATTGGNVSATSATAAIYTKIGNLVTVQFYVLNVSTTGMTAGNILYIRGLPFTAAAVAGTGQFPGSVILQSTTFSGYAVPATTDNTTYMFISEVTSGNNSVALTVSDYTSGAADIFLTMTYIAA